MNTNTARKMEEPVNGIDVAGLRQVIDDVGANPAAGEVEFSVRTRWAGQTRIEAQVDSYKIGGTCVERKFDIAVDEPFELLGQNTAPNPQELLMTALNACMSVGYVANAALRGIRIERLEIVTSGQLDLRGFLGIDPQVKAGYESVQTVVHIKAAATPAEIRDLHEAVLRTSPNYFNFTRPIRVDAELTVER